MRINVFIAQATGVSRREADRLVAEGLVAVNQQIAGTGQQVALSDRVTLRGRPLRIPETTTTIILNKPAGYVCSRTGQGSKTVYDLLPEELSKLKTVGRLDKDSSGLILLTNDGQLANKLTHPKYQKQKTYEATLDKTLSPADQQALASGIMLDDGLSLLKLAPLGLKTYLIKMNEGRNRQIRRTFQALGYEVISLNRTNFGPYSLTGLTPGQYKTT